MWPLFLYCWLSSGLIVFSPTIYGYFDPDMNFPLTSVLMGTSLHFIWFWDYVSIVLGGTLILISSALYSRYQFMQINHQIYWCLNHKDFGGVRKAIRNHNTVALQVNKMNANMSYFIYVFFKLCKPANNLILYISCEPDTHPLAAAVLQTMYVISWSVMFFITSMGTLVRSKARKTLTTFYSVMASSSRLQLKRADRIKILAFIERLSVGPEICFYCWDLFAVTSDNLLDFVLDSAASYILLINFVKNSGFA